MRENNNLDITKKIVVKSLIWKILERGFAQLAGIIIQIFLARLIAPESFGELAVIVSIINFASIFVQSGLSTVLVQKKEITDVDVSTMFYMSLGITLIVYLIIFILSPIIANYYGIPILKSALRVLGSILFLYAINAIQMAILTRRMEFDKIFYRSIIALPLAGGISIVMAYNGYGIWALIFYNILNALFTCLTMFFCAKIHLSLKFCMNSAREMYNFSIKIMFASIITSSHDLIRTNAIGRTYNTSELAYYDKGNTYSSYLVQGVTAAISSVMLPTFSKNQDDYLVLKKMLRRSSKLTAFIMWPLLAGVAALANPLIQLLLTDKWIASVPYLMIFCVLRMPSCLINIDKQVYYAIGNSGISLKYEVFLCFINIIMLILNLLIYPEAPMFIAIGATVVEFIGLVIIFFISKRLIGYSLKERFFDLIKPLFNTIVMFLIVYLIGKSNVYINFKLLFQIIVGILVYIFMALVTRDDSLRYLLETIKQFLGENKKKY